MCVCVCVFDQRTAATKVTHRVNSTQAMDLSEDIWTSTTRPASAELPTFDNPRNLSAVLQDAADSRRREHTFAKSCEREAHVTERRTASTQDVDDWLRALAERTEGERPVANEGQLKAVAAVATRVKCELGGEASTLPEDFGEPFRQLLHGGPGTGKSHVIHLLKELFIEVLGWTQGVQFQVVALQAVTADLIGGDTIHHACAIPVFSKTQTDEAKTQSHLIVAKRVLQWRWLIVDEISMVSAKLLALVDVKMRSVIREIGTLKIGADKQDLPFGGLNTLLVGDFWQLEPPDGGCLAGIPSEYIMAARKYSPAPTISHGQSLMWGGAGTGLQVVLELHECERCDDPWLMELQGECVLLIRVLFV